MIKKTLFYVRTSNATLTLNGDEKNRYILSRWPSV